MALGIMPSLLRPAVSNNNTYPESLFKTLRCRREYSAQPFADVTEARPWVSGFVDLYNFDYRHSAIQLVTPAEHHAELDTAIRVIRKAP